MFLFLQAGSVWLYIVPHGIRSLMNYIKIKYDNPRIIITENGTLLYIYRDLHLSLKYWFFALLLGFT